MSEQFFDRPVLNSPYEYPARHWELDESGQPTGHILGRRYLDHLAAANERANPGLVRLALELATGAGKTTVMAMLIAWQTVNAVRRPGSRRFTRGFLVVAPGLTIRDRLRVLQPNEPDSYYRSCELVPADMLGDLDRAKIVITNYHAFMRRETLAISQGRDQPGSLGDAEEQHLAPLRSTFFRPHRGQGHQPPRRRGDEGVPGVTDDRHGSDSDGT